jgi:hypothetical protein
MAALLIGFARCSTDQQDLTAQRHGLIGLGVAANRIYVDHGLTGTNRERPGLREALAACRDNGGVGYWNYLNSGPARLGACIALVATWLVGKPTRTAGRAQRARGAEAARQQAVALQAIQPSP